MNDARIIKIKKGKQMKYLVSSVLLAVISMSVNAQEYEVRSEFMYCKLNEGKAIADAIADSKRYGAFSKSEGTKYMQAVLTPMHAGDASEYDYIVWGTWPDGEAMYEEWGSYANNYPSYLAEKHPNASSAGSCHTTIAVFNAGVTHTRIPAEERDLRQPFQFARCSLKEGASIESLYAAAEKNKAQTDAAGFKGWGIHYFFPYLGFDKDLPYDFVQMNHWYSFEARGDMASKWRDFVTKNPEIQGRMEELVSCHSQRSFVGEMTFNNW